MRALVMGSLIAVIGLLASACGSEPLENDPVLVVRDFYDKINAGDLDGAMAYVPHDATFVAFDVLTGKDRIAEFYQREIELNTQYELIEIQADGNEVTYIVNVASDVAEYDSQEFRAVVERGMLISNRFQPR